MQLNQELTVLVPASDGCEEIETVSIIDVLRRSGAKVTFASIQPITGEIPILNGSNGIKLVCDTYLANVIQDTFDMIVLPGGLKNAEALSEHRELIQKLLKQKENGNWLAAICASPAKVFEKHNILEGVQATCHPSLQNILKNQSKIQERVVISKNIITSRSPGTALEFAITLVEVLYGSQKALQLATGMLIRR